MRVAASLVSFFAASALAAACSGSGSTSDGPMTAATLEAISGSFCARISQCFGDFLVKTALVDTPTCTSRLNLELKASAKGAGFAATDSAGQACKRAVEGASCAALLSDALPECDLRGTLADGAACANDSQCVSGACFVAEGAACGKCGARAAEGADCTNAKCQRGLACSTAKKCVKRVPEGGACDATTLCEEPLSCIAAKCAKGLPKDAACTNAKDATPCDGASGLFCKPPSIAQPASGTCSPVTLVAAGQACGLSTTPTIEYVTCLGSECIGATATTKGACTAFLADGAACDPKKGSSCQFPAKCRDGKCSVLEPAACK